MGQFILFTLFVIMLLVETFVPVQIPIDPMKFMMDKSNYTQGMSTTYKRTQHDQQVRDQMDKIQSAKEYTQRRLDSEHENMIRLKEERQRAQDQKLINQQRIEDQMQRIRDQRNDK